MFASNTIVNRCDQHRHLNTLPNSVKYIEIVVAIQYAIKHYPKRCTRHSLRTTELASSLYLRKLPNKHTIHSSQTIVYTCTHNYVPNFLVRSLPKTRLRYTTKCRRNSAPTNLLRPLPKHLPLRSSAQSAFHTRSQATAQRVHPTSRSSPSGSRERRQATTSRGAERSHQRGLQDATGSSASGAVLTCAAWD
jgi:hypothetical protein